MQYFRIKEDRTSGYTGTADGVHRWVLPGLLSCPVCGSTWGDNSMAYPSVDLTSITSLADFESPWPKPIEEYERMCALVRPLLPPGALLEPGSAFGPLVGRAKGRFGPLSSPFTWWVLVQPEALDQLQAEGLRGLKGCRTALRFRQRAPPDLLELELLPAGRAHADCLPPDRKPPCPRCGRWGLTLPTNLVLNTATLPGHLDIFRLEDFSTVLVCTRRFVDACQRLGLDGIAFHPLPTR